MKRFNKIALLPVAVLAVAAGLWWKSQPDPADAATLSKSAVASTRGPLRQTVQCTGNVVPNLSVEIKCKASGQIVKLPFDVSDQVHKGDLLVEIDPVEQARNVQKAEAMLKASRAKLAQSEAALVAAEKNLAAGRQRADAMLESSRAKAKDAAAKAKREKELLDKKLESPEEYETAQTNAEQAKQDVEAARADLSTLNAQEAELEVKRQDVKLSQADLESNEIALSLAQQYLSETKVMAPIDGVLSAQDVQIGQIIASGINNIGGGTSALTLADMSRLFVLASVDESQIGLVKLGQPVEITVDAFPSQSFDGKVMRIATTGEDVSNVITFEVKIEILSDNKSMLKPQMTANVEIITSEKTGVLRIPMAALSRTKEGTFVNVKKSDGSVAERVSVEVGISDGSDIEVIKGLEEGDAVLPKTSSAESSSQDSTKGMPPPMM